MTPARTDSSIAPSRDAVGTGSGGGFGPLNPPVKVGDKIRVVVMLEGGGSWLGTIQTVKSIWPDGTPQVRYRYGKVDKPIHHWVWPNEPSSATAAGGQTP